MRQRQPPLLLRRPLPHRRQCQRLHRFLRRLLRHRTTDPLPTVMPSAPPAVRRSWPVSPASSRSSTAMATASDASLANGVPKTLAAPLSYSNNIAALRLGRGRGIGSLGSYAFHVVSKHHDRFIEPVHYRVEIRGRAQSPSHGNDRASRTRWVASELMMRRRRERSGTPAVPPSSEANESSDLIVATDQAALSYRVRRLAFNGSPIGSPWQSSPSIWLKRARRWRLCGRASNRYKRLRPTDRTRCTSSSRRSRWNC